MSEVFSPYQIDYSVKNTSKTFGFSKKRITFKFGIANPPAVANGETGANCRGSEHEVIFTWSLNSGKRQILLDGKDVHYSETGQNGWTADQVFQHSWQFRVAGLSGPLRAHLITQPANKDVPHIKPFDLRINGISYFAMPKIFELGGPQMIVRPVKGGGPQKKGGYGGGSGGGRYGGGRGGDDDAYLSPAEREAIAAAKLASMQDLNRSGAGAGGHPSAAPPAPAVEDLISFDAPAPAPAYGQQPPPMQQRQYSNYSIGSSVNSASGAGAGAGSQYSQQSYPGAYGQQQQQLQQQQQQQQQPFYGQPPPPQPPSQPQAFYGQQPPPALAPNGPPTPSFDPHAMASPSNQSIASYQSYGSAPSFAQPPSQQQQQQQQQRPPPQMQQQQQQYPPQGGYYGQQPQRY